MTKKMSLKVTLFPRVLSLSKAGYIPDYVNAIDQSGNMEVVNPPHKNPLLNILSPKYWGDVFIFNWPENIPDARFGKIQTLLFFGLIGILKLRKKKIIWMFHNKMSHNKSHPFTKSLIMKAMARASTLIVTHAQEGAALVKASYPHAGKKTHFLDHPTKSRLEYMPAHIKRYTTCSSGAASRNTRACSSSCNTSGRSKPRTSKCASSGNARRRRSGRGCARPCPKT